MTIIVEPFRIKAVEPLTGEADPGGRANHEHVILSN